MSQKNKLNEINLIVFEIKAIFESERFFRFSACLAFFYLRLVLTPASDSEDSRSSRKPTKVPWGLKGGWNLGSSLHQRSASEDCSAWLAGRWGFAGPGFTLSAFGNRSHFWGNGIGYPAEAGADPLSWDSGGKRAGSSCLPRPQSRGPAPGHAHFPGEAPGRVHAPVLEHI